MKRILTIIGARPQIIKSAALSRAIRCAYATELEESILHTGQHYDVNMSEVFFRELGIPAPEYQLGVGSGSHGVQTAKMIAGVEEVLMQRHFDGVVVYGDTNSTLAGAVAAAKLHVPVFHVEAGLRSFNMAMPEEQNRIVCDHLSNICFAPTATAVHNLQREGLTEVKVSFAGGKGRRVVLSGDVMYDNSRYYATQASERCDVMRRLDLEQNPYVLVTVHRDYNTDNPSRLSAIFNALLDIVSQGEVRAVVPLHPRTAALLDETLDATLLERIRQTKELRLIEPVSFFEMIELERHARVVMTDSGGVQKEAFFYERPCVILRSETEWTELVEHGAAIVADADRDGIVAAYDTLKNRDVRFPELFGDGHAAEHIVEEIINY